MSIETMSYLEGRVPNRPTRGCTCITGFGRIWQ